MKADKETILNSLKTARGQIDGVLKMVEEDRYCIDISTQLIAIQAILRNINKEVLHAHLNCCVAEAFEKGGDDAQQKIQEIIGIIDKLSK